MCFSKQRNKGLTIPLYVCTYIYVYKSTHTCFCSCMTFDLKGIKYDDCRLQLDILIIPIIHFNNDPTVCMISFEVKVLKIYNYSCKCQPYSPSSGYNKHIKNQGE